MRLGLFGGSFDPVHYGHLLLAECCREQLHLDQVWFLPAAVPPHKQQRMLSAAEARLEMLELAIAGNAAFSVCSYEIERGGISYTVETLRYICGDTPEIELFLLMGADMLNDLPNWRNAAEILQLATPAVANRAGFDEPDFQGLAAIAPAEVVERIREHQVLIPQVELSSSDIRRRVAEGRSIRYRTPRAVQKYIETHGLYRAAQ